MADPSPGLTPQFIKPEENTADILQQILTELKKINTQLVLITDNVIREQDVIVDKDDES
jgi:hypothetical protein